MGSINYILALPLQDNSIIAVATESDNIIRIWDINIG